MNDIQIFNNHEFGSVRVVTINNEPWFVGKDVAEVLGYSKPTDAVSKHCKGVSKTGIPSNGGVQTMTVIPERDLYRLIMRSKLPQAEKFEEWVTSEVLPSIRKYGSYSVPMDDMEILSRAVLISNKKIEELKALTTSQQHIIEAQQPKVLLAETITNSNASILIGDLAKLLKKQGYPTGQNRLFADLREKGYLTKDNKPSQKSMELGIMEMNERIIKLPTYEKEKAVFTTKITGKGQEYFVNLYLGKKST